MKQIDARGLACPEPVILVRKGISENPEGLQVLVDNAAARENIKRFASARSYTVQVTEDKGEYTLTLQK